MFGEEQPDRSSTLRFSGALSRGRWNYELCVLSRGPVHLLPAGREACADAGFDRFMGVRDLSFGWPVCDARGFERPGVTHDEGKTLFARAMEFVPGRPSDESSSDTRAIPACARWAAPIIVADAFEADRKHVLQEAADEFGPVDAPHLLAAVPCHRELTLIPQQRSPVPRRIRRRSWASPPLRPGAGGHQEFALAPSPGYLRPWHAGLAQKLPPSRPKSSLPWQAEQVSSMRV